MRRYAVWGTRKSKQFAGRGYHGRAQDLQHLGGEISQPISRCSHTFSTASIPPGGRTPMGWPWGPAMGTVPKWAEAGEKSRTEPWTGVTSHELCKETSWTINYNKRLFFFSLP